MQMNEEIISASFGNNLTEQTRQKYATTLMKWMTHSTKHLTDLLQHPEEAIQLLSTFPIKHTPENHHTYLTPMVAYLHYVAKEPQLEEKWTILKRTNWEPIQQRYDENRPSENQTNQLMSFEEILAIRETLPMGSIERLLLSFYSVVEANRADYFATELITTPQESTEENYIVDGMYLVLTDFKTKATYKKIDNTLSEEVQEELRESLRKRPRRYLFTREDNTPYPNRKQFSNWACRTLTTVLKHPMTLTTMRHLYIGHHMKNKTPKELTDMAKKMGHTRSMQRAYEWVSPTQSEAAQSPTQSESNQTEPQ
jgi:hypothetical protein